MKQLARSQDALLETTALRRDRRVRAQVAAREAELAAGTLREAARAFAERSGAVDPSRPREPRKALSVRWMLEAARVLEDLDLLPGRWALERGGP